MQERWKPENGNEYYVMDILEGDVCEYTWEDDLIDKGYWEAGNCFRTEAEAQAAAEKVKALLLSLHDKSEILQPVANCNQLPKLTAKVFDRPDCPGWAQYAAVGQDGRAWYFEAKPSLLVNSFFEIEKRSTMLTGFFCCDDWQNSLIERPAKLPEWCKVGAKAWRYILGYVSLEASDLENPGFADAVQRGEIVQARFRPYNAEEMKSLVGKIVCTKTDKAIVGGYRGADNTIVLACIGNSFSAETLLKVGATIDGTPCGVLEHLENGEWVK